jgi:hypothetical protein
LLTFDTISACFGGSLVPNGYGCLNWTEIGYLDGHTQPVGSGYYNSVVSGDYNTYNSGGVPMSIKSMTTGTTFTINSFYATASTVNGLVVTVTGSHLGSTLYNITYIKYIYSTTSNIKLVWSGYGTVYTGKF